MFTSINEFKKYNESLNQITFTKESDDDGDLNQIDAFVDGKRAGKLVYNLEFEPRWKFEEELTDDEYDQIFTDDKVVCLEHIDVNEDFRGGGVAKALMSEAIADIKKAGITIIHLNASPMGSDGLQINDLTNFYESFGFKSFLHQGSNNLMVLYL